MERIANIEAGLNASRSAVATVPPVKLPEGAAASAPSIEDLVALLDKEQDPKARFTRAREIQALRWAKN